MEDLTPISQQKALNTQIKILNFKKSLIVTISRLTKLNYLFSKSPLHPSFPDLQEAVQIIKTIHEIFLRESDNIGKFKLSLCPELVKLFSRTLSIIRQYIHNAIFAIVFQIWTNRPLDSIANKNVMLSNISVSERAMEFSIVDTSTPKPLTPARFQENTTASIEEKQSVDTTERISYSELKPYFDLLVQLPGDGTYNSYTFFYKLQFYLLSTNFENALDLCTFKSPLTDFLKFLRNHDADFILAHPSYGGLFSLQCEPFDTDKSLTSQILNYNLEHLLLLLYTFNQDSIGLYSCKDMNKLFVPSIAPQTISEESPSSIRMESDFREIKEAYQVTMKEEISCPTSIHTQGESMKFGLSHLEQTHEPTRVIFKKEKMLEFSLQPQLFFLLNLKQTKIMESKTCWDYTHTIIMEVLNSQLKNIGIVGNKQYSVILTEPNSTRRYHGLQNLFIQLTLIIQIMKLLKLHITKDNRLYYENKKRPNHIFMIRNAQAIIKIQLTKAHVLCSLIPVLKEKFCKIIPDLFNKNYFLKPTEKQNSKLNPLIEIICSIFIKDESSCTWYRMSKEMLIFLNFSFFLKKLAKYMKGTIKKVSAEGAFNLTKDLSRLIDEILKKIEGKNKQKKRQNILSLPQVKRFQSIILFLGTSHEYSHLSVDLSEKDYRMVSKLQLKEIPRELSKLEELKLLTLFEETPISLNK